MNRIFVEDSSTTFQVKLDNRLLLNTITRNKEEINLRDFFIILRSNLVREELLCLQKELNIGVSERISVVSETIPDEIWMTIFTFFAHEKDISRVFPLQQVCKRWFKIIPGALTEASINRYPDSLDRILPLTSLRSLTINIPLNVSPEVFDNVFTKLEKLVLADDEITSDVDTEYWTKLSKLSTLDFSKANSHSDSSYDFIINPSNINLLTNLQHLKIGNNMMYYLSSFQSLVKMKTFNVRHDAHVIDHDVFEDQFGENIEVLDSFKELEIVKLNRFPFLNCKSLQEAYPHVRFIWTVRVHRYGIMDDLSVLLGQYEGAFSENNFLDGKGVMHFRHGRFEGTFKNDKRVKGIIFYKNGHRCEIAYNVEEGIDSAEFFDANGVKYADNVYCNVDTGVPY
jgi:hypothetical protein